MNSVKAFDEMKCCQHPLIRLPTINKKTSKLKKDAMQVAEVWCWIMLSTNITAISLLLFLIGWL